MISVTEVLNGTVGKRTADITPAVVMDFSYEVFPFGLNPVDPDPADPFFGLAIKHFDDFFYFLFRCHNVASDDS